MNRVTACQRFADPLKHTDLPTVLVNWQGDIIDYHYPKGFIHAHDVAAGKLILEEAGGVLVDETGRELDVSCDAHETSNVFALNARSSFDCITYALHALP